MRSQSVKLHMRLHEQNRNERSMYNMCTKRRKEAESIQGTVYNVHHR